MASIDRFINKHIFSFYSCLNSEHLKIRNIRVTNFYLFVTQMVDYSDALYVDTRNLNTWPSNGGLYIDPLTKRRSEYQTTMAPIVYKMTRICFRFLNGQISNSHCTTSILCCVLSKHLRIWFQNIVGIWSLNISEFGMVLKRMVYLSDFEWDLKFIRVVLCFQKPFEIQTKISGFGMIPFSNSPTIWNLTFKKSRVQMFPDFEWSDFGSSPY